MDIDALLAIGHHIAAFSVLAMLAAEWALVRPGITRADAARLRLIDAAYGVAAGAVLVIGFGRLFGGAMETIFYFGNPFFWAKLAAFGVIGLLSIGGTMRYQRWAGAAAAGSEAPSTQPSSLAAHEPCGRHEVRGTMAEHTERSGGGSMTSSNGTDQQASGVREHGQTQRAGNATWTVKAGLAQMLKGGVIMDVVTAEHAQIAEEAGACAVMALERVPSDIRTAGGVARMSHVKLIEEICRTVTIPVMAKARIGHFVEAQILQAIGVDYVDESEVLTPADDTYHIDKTKFAVPFVCGCRDLGEALRRISEGAAMIRTKGEAGTGDIVEAVRHMRALWGGIRRVHTAPEDELAGIAKEYGVSLELVREVHKLGKLPVVNFSAGGVATPADAALMMQLGAEGVFVGSGIFKSGEGLVPKEQRQAQAHMASAIVRAVTHFDDPDELARVSREIGEPMRGRSASSLAPEELLAGRGN